MPEFPDSEGAHRAYYRRLEVGPAASHDDIVRAYRRLALAVHPDAHPEDPEAAPRFREITEAYEVLADPRRRQEYDRRAGPLRIAVRPQGRDENATRHASPPVFLGGRWDGLSADVPLRVGPVHVGDPGHGDAPRSALVQALFEILDTWRVR